MSVPVRGRRLTAGVAVVGALALSACGPETPIEGWGPGTAPPVVVTVAPAEAPAVEAAAPEPPPSSPPAPSAEGDAAAEAPDDPPPPPETPPPPTEPPAPVFAPNGQTVRVRSLDNSFRNEKTEVVVGTEILWTNDGRNEHDVLPVDDSQEWGVTRDDFEPGDEYRYVFLEPGTYAYYCSLHGTKEVGMVGTIVVTAP